MDYKITIQRVKKVEVKQNSKPMYREITEIDCFNNLHHL